VGGAEPDVEARFRVSSESSARMASVRIDPRAIHTWRPAPRRRPFAIADAEAFGRIVGRNWEGALLVARSAERAEQGRRSDLAQIAPGQKLSLRRFAELAGCSRKTAAAYLDAWDRAAADGVVPPAGSLAPGADVDLARLDARAWAHYYTARPAKRVAEVDWAKKVIAVIEGRPPAGGRRFSSPEPHVQLARYVAVMSKLPPPLLEGSWSPVYADRWAGALARALHRVRPSELSDPRRLAAQLREEADRLEAAAPDDEGSR
jgi:hypothetical protein